MAGHSNSAAPAKKTDWPTVILVILTGLGDFGVSVSNSTQRQADAVRAFHQIDTLHSAVADFESRQKAELVSLEQALKNQTDMLRNQNAILNEVRAQNSPAREP